ncbi:MAG TPA: hypothetical protein VMU81_11720 [Acetobacteraceae bacterium]|nr:hypothetical protein [Acetobacteraceae bacterium]
MIPIISSAREREDKRKRWKFGHVTRGAGMIGAIAVVAYAIGSSLALERFARRC